MLPRFDVPRSFVVVAVLGSIIAMASPARAGLGVGAAAPFDPAKIRAVRSQEHVAAAGDGATTLFAWVDLRSGNPDIYAARVQADGTVLDPNGIAVASTGSGETAPAVSWNGSEWLVVFVKDGSGIYGARVAPDGEVLDPSAIEIAASPFTDDQPAAAGLGSAHAVVWRSGDLGYAIYGALIASDGSFDVSPGILSQPGSGVTDASPAIAVRDTVALVAFTTNRNGNTDIYGLRFKRSNAGPPALVRLDATDVAISTGIARTDEPAVGASASAWLVAWEDGRNAGTGIDIYASRVGAGGAVQDASGIQVSDDTGNEGDPAVVHTGSEWLVAWSEADAGQFLRAVANNGNPAAQRIDVSTAAGTLGQGAFGGDPATPLIAWSDPEPGSSGPKPPQDLLGRSIAADLDLGEPFVIATQTPNQTQPAMSYGGGRFLVAWVDDRFGGIEGMIRYAVTDSGRLDAPLPEAIQPIALRPGLDQAQPAACFDGTNFNLYWSELKDGYRRIAGARLTPGGALIDTFIVAEDAWDHVEPACAHHGNGIVDLIWTDHRLPLNSDLWGRRILNGVLLGNELLLANSPENESRPRLAPRVVDGENNSSFFVYQRNSGPGTGAIYGQFLYESPFLTSGEYFVRTDAGRIFESPQIAWNGDMWLVTYQELVENDGPGLYIPWATWIGHPYQTISPGRQIGPGSYVPANPIAGSAGANFVTLRSRLAGSQVDLDVRRAEGSPGFADDDPIPYTSDPEVDVPGAAAQGQGDRVGLLHLRRQDDAEWQGLRLFGADARDTLEGRVVINEFLANPPSGVDEFYELFNVSGQDFQLLGWVLVVDGDSTEVEQCYSDAPGPGPDAGKGGGDVTLGSICGVIPDQTYFGQSEFFGIQGTPEEGKLPNRGAVLELFTPGGVKVDEVRYGYKGGAPVSPPLPIGEAPAARIDPAGLATQAVGGGPVVAAPGDSVAVSTARLPDGTDTNGDANDFNSTTNSTPGGSNAGNASALNTSLIVTRLFWNPPAGSVDAVELYNPYDVDIDFSNWYLGSNDGTQRIGVPGNAWSVLRRHEKRVLRRGEVGSFTTDLDYLTVVYLFKPDFTRVEQIGWSRADNAQPEMCMRRDPDTGGFHDGFDWLSSGGEQELFVGQLHYEACPISGPDAVVDVSGPATLAFRGAVPNPMSPGRGVLVFSVPGASGGAGAHVRLRLIDVAGRVRSTLVDGPMVPGEHRIGLATGAAGVYYAELEIGGRRLTRPVVVVP